MSSHHDTSSVPYFIWGKGVEKGSLPGDTSSAPHPTKTCASGSKSSWHASRKCYRKWRRSLQETFLCAPRDNTSRALALDCQNQINLRNTGGRCRKSRAWLLLNKQARWLFRLQAKCLVPIVSLVRRPCERSTSKPSLNERLLAASPCPATRCIGFSRRSRFLSDASSRIEEVCLTPTNPTFSIGGRQAAGTAPSCMLKPKHLATPAPRPCFVSLWQACASTIRQQETR